MRPEPLRVAIDLETTGLRPDQDVIIEIGAVKFAGAQRLDTFQSFVNIATPLPYRIHRLTGITNADLRRAPQLNTLLADLRAFIGTAPLVGHSVSFDASFLRKVGLAQRNPLIDTYELASLLLPELPSYTLGSVADALQVTSSIHHRALADADLSRAVFLALMERLDALDTGAISELAALPADPGWTPAYLIKAQQRDRAEAVQSSPFASLLAAAPSGGTVGKGISPDVLSLAVALEHPAEAPEPAAAPPVVVVADPAPDATPLREPWASLGAFLRDGGPLLMEMEATDDALERALTSIAQAAPDARIVIAASDSDEMKRIARTALPAAILRAGLAPQQATIAELDEREAYLCLSRWFGVARESQGRPLTPELTRGLAKLTVWARGTTTGMRGDVALSGGQAEAWAHVRSGVDFAATCDDCPYRNAGYCFVERAAQRATSARIVVTTHAALTASLSGRDTLLPSADRVVILDARAFEETARRRLTFSLDATSLLAQLDTLATPEVDGQRAGLLPLTSRSVISTFHTSKHQTFPTSTFEASMTQTSTTTDNGAAGKAVDTAREATFTFFAALRTVLFDSQERSGRSDGGDAGSLRIESDVRRSRAWSNVERAWATLSASLRALNDVLHERAETLAVALDEPRVRGVHMGLLAAATRFDETLRRGADVIDGQDEPSTVCWLRAPQQYQPAEPPRGRRASTRGAAEQHASAVEAPEPERADPTTTLLAEAPTLNAAPVQIGALLAPLCADGRGVAALGWALSVGGDFEYIRAALGFPDAARAIAASPDYSRQTLLCLPSDAPEPNAQSYHSQLESLIVSLARQLEGDVVAIFPSHAALRSAAMGIRRGLERYDILVLAQGIDGSARQLWNTFNGQPRTVLLGAGAFWDGDALSGRAPACVVVTRTPFPPQSDPLVAARAEQWTDAQSQFMTPQAALKLRQALGGLAWSQPRRNAVVLFDRRLQTRGYGATILGTLPQCEVYEDAIADLPEHVADWTRQSPASSSRPSTSIW